MSILRRYPRFAFTLIPGGVDQVRGAIVAVAGEWGKKFAVDQSFRRDVRAIYDSPTGPDYPPAIHIGILISEVPGREGPRTAFVSSVADGYLSLIHRASTIIPGAHLSFSISRSTEKYPRNALTAIQGGEQVRTVSSMLDTGAWEFFEKGDPLTFEIAAYYAAWRKRDRLTPEIIAKYLDTLGYASLEEDFWVSCSPGHLLCEEGFRLGTCTR